MLVTKVRLSAHVHHISFRQFRFQLGGTTLPGGRRSEFKYLLGQLSILCLITRSMKPTFNINQINSSKSYINLIDEP